MANRLHREEWRALAVLAFVLGNEAGWKSREQHPGRQVGQETITRAALAAMERSALVGQHVGNAELAECWQHNFYRGWRMAETGSPTTPVYKGCFLYQRTVEPDDYQPEGKKARAGARE